MTIRDAGQQPASVPGRARLDEIDLAILDLLKEDARRTVTDISSRVNLSAAPVKRRIDRLEGTGIIRSYTVVLDESALHSNVEALCHLRLTSGDADEVAVWLLRTFQEVEQVSATAGEDDLVASVRVEAAVDLHTLVSAFRRHPRVLRTRTAVVLRTWSRDVDMEALRDPGTEPGGRDGSVASP